MSSRLLLLVFCVVLFAVVPVKAQSDDVLPPRVTSILPLAGVPIAANDALTITFNQPMEAASLMFEPEVAGVIEWPNPLTLTFIPAEAWPVGVTYTVTLTATGASGVDLAQPKVFELWGPLPLSVVTVSPSAAANAVSANTELLIGFDRPVVTLDQVGVKIDDLDVMPVTLQSGDWIVLGTGEWITTSMYSFTLQDPLPGGIRYTATVAAGLNALDGTQLAEPYSWSFATVLPNALAVEATDERNYSWLQPNSVLELEFNQAMDRALTEAVIHLERTEIGEFEYRSEAVPVNYSWREDDRVLLMEPQSLLVPGYEYTVVFTDDARSASGAVATFESSLLNLGRIDYAPRNFYPGLGTTIIPGWHSVSFMFTMPMDNESFRDHYRIVPEPAGEVDVIFSEDNTIFSLSFEHTDNTTYTVALLAGIKNAWGHIWPEEILLHYQVESAPTAQRNDSVSLNLPYPLVTFPTYAGDPALDLRIYGQPTAEFAIYRAGIDVVVQSENEFYGHNRHGLYYPPPNLYYSSSDIDELMDWEPSVPWVTDENRVHQWEQTFNARASNDRDLLLTLADGEPLPLGLYGLELTSNRMVGYRDRDGVLIAVANVGITVKAAADGDSAIWVTDLQSGQPVPGATVAIYGADGALTATGVTDDEGVFRVPPGPFVAVGSSSSSDPYRTYYSGRFSGINFVEVTGDELYGAWHSGNVYGTPATNGYLYTDRPIYRPGETVYFRGVLRDRVDMTYTVPPEVTTARVQVGQRESWWQRELIDVFHTADLVVSEFGTVSGSFVIPADLALSAYGRWAEYGILITACATAESNCAQYSVYIDFEVAEFRVPEFEVDVTSNVAELKAGDLLDVDVNAAYYFGGALNGAGVSWTVSGNSSYFNYEGAERGYTFGRYRGSSSCDASNGDGRLDQNGQFHVDQVVECAADVFRPVSLTVEATVSDESDQSISAISERITVHPSQVYIGLRAADRFQNADTPFDVDVLTVTPQSEFVANQPVIIEITEHVWVRTSEEFGHYDYEDVETQISSEVITTNANGHVVYQFVAPHAGRYEIVARTQDSAGHLAETVLWVYANDRYDTENHVWWTRQRSFYDWNYFYRNEAYINLLAENTSYVPGDTAEVLIPNPFDRPVEVLVTVERAGVIQHEAVRIEGDALVYTFDVTDEHAPGVWVSIVMIRPGIDGEPDPFHLFGRIRLSVAPTARELNIELTPSAPELAPREAVSFDVQVTDADGNPVQAEVGLHLTDEAALALRPSNSYSILSTFYSDSTLRVYVTTSHMSLLTYDEREGYPGMGGGGGGGGGDATLIREDFVYTPLWAPHVVTDDAGHATVSVTLPDNLTRWRLDARAVTLDTNVGQAETTVISTLPLIVRPDVPRYFVVGDQLPVTGIINNQTDVPQTVTVTLESTGLRLLEGVPVVQTVEVAPLSRQVVEWPVVVEDVPGVDLTLYAEATSGLTDAAKPALRTGPDDTVMVYRYVAPEMMATSGVLTDAGRAQEGLLFPADVKPLGGELTVQLESSLVAPITGGLDYLREYPHFCVEQTVSRFYPNLMTEQLLAGLGADDPELVVNLQANIEPALQKLIAEQNEDGGWGWFGRMESNSYVTAYVLLALADAGATGYVVPDETMVAGVEFLNDYLADLDIAPTTRDYQFNRAAFAIYALARAGAFPQDTFDNVIVLRERLSSTALAHLAVAVETSGQAALAVDLVDDLVDRALVTGTGTHWVDTRDAFNWSSNTRTTATVTLALIRLQPDHPALPGAIRWLMTARRADHWPTTQETAWTVLALGEWLGVTGELNGEYAYHLALNDAELASGAVTPAAIQASQGAEASLRVEVVDLLKNDVNLLDISRSTGPGALYYVAGLRVEWPADEVESLSRGITVERSYRNVGRDWQTIDHITVGEMVQVRLNFTLDQDTHYFVLEDALPAGLEVLDTNLLTTSREVESPRATGEGKYWWWWRYFDRIEARDTGAVIYADYLPRGSYTFTYTVMATQSGTFQAIPAQAYAFYTPEVFGRSEGALFTVDGE